VFGLEERNINDENRKEIISEKKNVRNSDFFKVM